ncbi:serine hydrolase FSH [Xylariomycetidae sp. FL2044]|nr:serine hydrolase FSH [Xylariomycetidae sp. FL2044]
MDPPKSDNTLHLPRILCLHGGGTNALIFRMQCRVLSRQLSPHFRLAYAEAPYDSAAGPDVLSVYADHGPFKRWLRWQPEHAAVEDRQATRSIDGALRAAMDADDRAGADGPWVGLLGFSQGAKVAASLLYRQQARRRRAAAAAASASSSSSRGQQRAVDEMEEEEEEEEDKEEQKSDWKFAVLMAGRAPIVNLDVDLITSSLLSRPSETTLTGTPDLMDVMGEDHVLRLPTVHVHGLSDPGLHLHRELLEHYCDPATARLVEWEGGHRVPLKGTDVGPVVDRILETAKETGVLDT